ncbi:MAG: hypothetical protein RL541_13 [Pseudomonadota bacterium]
MKFKIAFAFVMLVSAVLVAQVVRSLFGDNLEEWSLRFSIALTFSLIGYLGGKGSLAEIIKEEPIPLIIGSAVYLYVLNVAALLIVILVPSALVAYFLCNKLLRT